LAMTSDSGPDLVARVPAFGWRAARTVQKPQEGRQFSLRKADLPGR
jgi:hypothetical protein